MPTVQHSTLTGANSHEPKGVESATNEDVYVADGLGSGNWKEIQVMGWEDWNHGGGAQALTLAATEYQLENDGAGTQTNTAYKLNGSTNIWDTVNNEFDWAAGGCEVGDTVDIRVDITYTANSSNDGFTLELDMAVGGTTPFTVPIDDRNLDVAGSENVVRFVSVYIGSTDVLNNPAQFKVTADSTGDTVQVNGWYVRVIPRNPRFL